MPRQRPKPRLRDIGDAHADLTTLSDCRRAGVTARAKVFRRALQWAGVLIVGIGGAWPCGSLDGCQRRTPALLAGASAQTTPPTNSGRPSHPTANGSPIYRTHAAHRRVGEIHRRRGLRQPDRVRVARDSGPLGHRRPRYLARRSQHRSAGKAEWQYGATFDTWLIPAPLGGTPRRFVETSAALRWSPDGNRIVYVRPGETRGDAIVVADSNGANPRDIVPARGGVHTHWPAWSADGGFVYFVQTIATWNGEPSEIVRVPPAVESRRPSCARRAGRFSTSDRRRRSAHAANPSGSTRSLVAPVERERAAAAHEGVGEYAEPRMSSHGRTLVNARRAPTGAGIGPGGRGGKDPVAPAYRRFSGDLDPCVSTQTGRMVFSSSRSGNRISGRPARTDRTFALSPRTRLLRSDRRFHPTDGRSPSSRIAVGSAVSGS